MNNILNKLIRLRNGHYVHALDVFDLDELKDSIESLVDQFHKQGYNMEDIKEFFNTISIYHLEDEELDEETNDINKDELYAFDIDNYITETYE